MFEPSDETPRAFSFPRMSRLLLCGNEGANIPKAHAGAAFAEFDDFGVMGVRRQAAPGGADAAGGNGGEFGDTDQRGIGQFIQRAQVGSFGSHGDCLSTRLDRRIKKGRPSVLNATETVATLAAPLGLLGAFPMQRPMSRPY